MSLPAIKLYTARICPYAQRVTLPLAHLEIPHDAVEIDLKNKPHDYAATVNRASKVPVIAVGNAKIPESLVCLEYLADLLPGKIHIDDIVARAESRYFVQRYADIVSSPMQAVLMNGDTSTLAKLTDGLKEITQLFTARPGHYFHGDSLTFADYAVSPFLGRFIIFGRAGMLPNGYYEGLLKDDELTPLIKYGESLLDLPAFKATFDTDYVIDYYKTMLVQRRAEATAANPTAKA